MLEVDDDSRLGRELIAGGTRYHAHFVPDDEATADFYVQACEELNAAGIRHYEISNFAREGSESRHNLKYWTRQPYFGFGVDAHSMLSLESEGLEPAIRFSTDDSLDGYMSGGPHTVTMVTRQSAIEESFFLGLRLNRGVDIDQLGRELNNHAIAAYDCVIDQCLEEGVLEREGSKVRLTGRGRLLSNEVFARFLMEQGKEEGKVGTGSVNPR
jgi:oxygen-independent coproporphyrinogen-3 oxidase